MTKADIAAILAQYQPRIRKAFLDAIQSIKDQVVLADVARALQEHDVEGAVRALNLDPKAFARVESEITAAYEQSGFLAVQRMPMVADKTGAKVVLRFGTRGTDGEKLLRDHSSQLITNVTEEAKQIAREVFSTGLGKGTNPTQTARELIGTVNRVTGKREGGVIGLSAPQASYVSNPAGGAAGARQQLESGDPALLRKYLTRQRRDKRFDRTVMKAVREGKPIPQATIEKMLTGYSNKLMALRGDAIGLNETLSSMAIARDDAWKQQIDDGKMDAAYVTKTWHHNASEHPRLQHIMMDGKTVNYGDDFVLPDGTRMKHPHDPEAGPGQNIFCHCRTEYRHRAIDQLLGK